MRCAACQETSLAAQLTATRFRRTIAAAGNCGSYDNSGHSDAPSCSNCGWIMVGCGACYRRDNCGTTSGCG